MKTTITALSLAIALCIVTPATAAVFEGSLVGPDPAGPAAVTAFGLRLVTISVPGGRLSPLGRAQVVAGRLESLLEKGALHAGSISARADSRPYGLWVVECATPDGPAIILTVDHRLGRAATDTEHPAARAAAWWAALLADYAAVAAARPPRCTAGSPVAEVLAGMASRMSRQGQGFGQAIAQLTPEQRALLDDAAAAVPPGWQPVAADAAPAVPSPTPPSPVKEAPATVAPPPAPPEAPPKWGVSRTASRLTITWQGDNATMRSVEFIMVDRQGDPVEAVRLVAPPFQAEFRDPPAGAQVRVWATDRNDKESLLVVPVTAQ